MKVLTLSKDETLRERIFEFLKDADKFMAVSIDKSGLKKAHFFYMSDEEIIYTLEEVKLKVFLEEE
jgi:hypothetical protein